MIAAIKSDIGNAYHTQSKPKILGRITSIGNKIKTCLKIASQNAGLTFHNA
jgi:hypothetical protein